MSNEKRVLVLGGTGFLGRHVMREVAALGHQPIALSRRTGTDLLDYPAVEQAVRAAAPDVVINCAAHVGSVHYAIQHAADVVSDNLLMLVHLYKAVHAAAPRAKIINPISNCSYPGEADVHSEPDWERGPVHDTVISYGGPRRMIHTIAESYRKQHGTRSVNWLVANAYGPGDHLDPNKVHALNGIVIRLIQARRRGDKAFVIWGTGRPVREWVFIEDVARMLALSIDAVDEQTYPVNLAQHQAWSIAEIAEKAANLMGYDVGFQFDTSKPDGAPTKILDDRAFRSLWPDFSFTPLDDGIRRTIAYFEQALPT